MKTLLTSLIIAGGALLPIAQVHAAPASKDISFAAKTYNGLNPGKKFTLTVTTVASTRSSFDGGLETSAIPSGIPKFKQGAKVKFSIGSKGELKGPGFSIKYVSSNTGASMYANKAISEFNPDADTATIVKNKNKPYGAVLTFYKISGKAMKTAINYVGYGLE